MTSDWYHDVVVTTSRNHPDPDRPVSHGDFFRSAPAVLVGHHAAAAALFDDERSQTKCHGTA